MKPQAQAKTLEKAASSADGAAPQISASLTWMPCYNWLSPGQLIMTAVRALLGNMFGAYADRREMQAALSPDAAQQDVLHLSYAHRDELWMDYVADLGDGWDATYSIAWLLSQAGLKVTEGGAERVLPRGELLIMGGDQVYPTASRTAYEQRFKGPYTAALPYVKGISPRVVAIPGNHDWYDGGGGFLRLFCQQRWVGGRQTLQRRSYFALRLPHNWWLWAVDIQLESDIDDPQKQYFQQFAEELQAGDRVIICPPVPSWIDAGDTRLLPDPDAMAAHPNLTYLEGLVREQGAEVQLSLSGDRHHYARYEQVMDADQPAYKKRHKLTAGGGGAFLCGTHDLPATLELQEDGQRTQYALQNPFPSLAISRAMCWYNLALCCFNPAFALFLGCLYLFYAWIWQSASKGLAGTTDSLMLTLSRKSFTLHNAVCEVLPALWRSISHHPGTLLLSLVPVLALLAFAAAPPRKWAGLRRFVWGGLHGCAHSLLALALLWFFSRVNLSVIAHHYGLNPEIWVDGLTQIALIAVEIVSTGFVVGGSMFGLYLVLSNWLSGMHEQEVYSALHIADYKNFLRLHISKDVMTIYAFKVRKVCRRWRINTLARELVSAGGWLRPRTWRFKIDEKNESPWFEPASGRIEAELIEKIEIPAWIKSADKTEGRQ